MPSHSQTRLDLRERFKSWRRRHRQPWRVESYGGIKVHYKDCLDGGGGDFGQDFIPFLTGRGMPRQRRIFEWCAGPAFIGFSLLGHGLCETLCLADINLKAVTACRRTIAENGLGDRVAVYRSDNLNTIPPGERWDLVVANPPHFDGGSLDRLRTRDDGWRLHREFFASVGRFLRPGGVVVLQENNQGSTVETFRAMIEAAGLAIVFAEGCQPRPTPAARYYYIGIMRRGDPVPIWAREARAAPAA